MGEGVDALLGHAATSGIPVRSTLGQTERRAAGCPSTR